MHEGDANLIEAWGLVSSACEGDFDDDGEVALVATGSPLAFLNLAVSHGPPVDAAAALTRIERFYGERDLDYMVWASDLHGSALAEEAKRRGLEQVGQAPGMVRDTCPAPPGPPGLHIEAVAGLAAYDRYMAVVAEGFGLPFELGVQVFRPALFERSAAVGLLGSVDGEPVSTAAMIPAAGVAGVYMVATPERFRGRGYGEALTWAAVEAGLGAGYGTAVLQASAMGRPIYERMGFSTYATYLQLGRS